MWATVEDSIRLRREFARLQLWIEKRRATKLRAERRDGELLAEMKRNGERDPGGRGKIGIT